MQRLVGLLTRASTDASCLPGCAPVANLLESSALTVAGPCRNYTGFPKTPDVPLYDTPEGTSITVRKVAQAFYPEKFKCGILFWQMRDRGVYSEQGLAAIARRRTLRPRKDELTAMSSETREAAGATTLDAGCHGHRVRPGS